MSVTNNKRTGVAYVELGKGNNGLTYFAYCPTHETRTSAMRSAIQPDFDNQIYIMFKCKEGHLFPALPTRGFPRTPAEAQQWIDKLRAGKLRELSKPIQ